MKPILFLITIFLFLPFAYSQQTWIVAQDGTGDYLEIQDAITNASPGDLILVKPGVYKAIWINKPLNIVGSGKDQTIISERDPNGDFTSPIYVSYPGLSGECLLASLTADNNTGFSAVVGGATPTGQFILWQVKADNTTDVGNYSYSSSISLGLLDLVLLNNCEQGSPPSSGSWEQRPGLSLSNVLALVSESPFQAWDWAFLHGARGDDGAPGIRIRNGATAYLSESNGTGARGLNGWQVGCQDFWSGGRGGDGVHVGGDSTLTMSSRLGSFGEGGRGGEGFNPDPFLCDEAPPGGDGGDGIRATDPGASAFLSGIAAIPGIGGPGDPPGDEGLPIRGNVNHLPNLLPTSTTTGDGKPGSMATFSFHGDPGETLLIVYSTKAEVLEIPGVDGPPLIPSAQGQFGFLDGGVFPAGGTITITTTLPGNIPLGQPLYVQGVVQGDHPPQLTNMSMIVTTPDW